MELEVLRFSSQKDSTNGLLFNITGGKRTFVCYTLEDEHRDKKVKHETRIPQGTYQIKLRTWGGFHTKYSRRFADVHVGMLEITDVPNFTDILIHGGNTDEDTSGCLLVGNSQKNNIQASNGFVGESIEAYLELYRQVKEALLRKESVTIKFTNYDKPN
jgi:hypothetical protein